MLFGFLVTDIALQANAAKNDQCDQPFSGTGRRSFIYLTISVAAGGASIMGSGQITRFIVGNLAGWTLPLRTIIGFLAYITTFWADAQHTIYL
ncbi:hypothetical protein ACO0LC_15225 [Undibacterium sp. JH2W]